VAVALAAGAYWHYQRPARRLARALQALDAKQYGEVQRGLESLEHAEGYEPHRRFLRGALLLHDGKPYPALAEFGHSVNHEALRVRTLVLSGQALYQVGQFREAIGLLVQAAEADPDAVDAHRWLALAYDDLGLTSHAMAHLKRIAELVPDDPRPHRLMGLIEKDGEQYEAAAADYRESLRRQARQFDREQILLELAECEIKQRRRYEAALETLAQCAPSPNRWAAEAECHYAAGRAAEAHRLLDQALKEAPAHLPGLLLKATIAMGEGNAKLAVDLLSAAVVAYPKDYTAQFKLSQAYRRVGNDAQADKHGQIANDIKRVREEFSELHGTAAAEPANAAVRWRLGVLARELDRADLARVWFRAALAIDPRRNKAPRNLAEEESRGSQPQARGR
jgi:tetratricopeptide (TPR) repeat protein